LLVLQGGPEGTGIRRS